MRFLRVILVQSLAILALAGSFSVFGYAQTPDAPKPQGTAPNTPGNTLQGADYSKPWSHFPDPIAPYMPKHVAPVNLNNSSRIDQLIRDGKLMLSMDDAIALTLENNLDLVIARYNLNIADTDVLRAKSANRLGRGRHQSWHGRRGRGHEWIGPEHGGYRAGAGELRSRALQYVAKRPCASGVQQSILRSHH
jgi:hypothetical protein